MYNRIVAVPGKIMVTEFTDRIQLLLVAGCTISAGRWICQQQSDVTRHYQ
jgi:hypothetical protein